MTAEYKELNKQLGGDIKRDASINQKIVETLKMIKEVEGERDRIKTLLNDGDEKTAEFFRKLIEHKFDEMMRLRDEQNDLNADSKVTNPNCVLKVEGNDREIM